MNFSQTSLRPLENTRRCLQAQWQRSDYPHYFESHNQKYKEYHVLTKMLNKILVNSLANNIKSCFLIVFKFSGFSPEYEL